MKNIITTVNNKNTTVDTLKSLCKSFNITTPKSFKRTDYVNALLAYVDEHYKRYDIKTVECTYNIHCVVDNKTVMHIYTPTKRQPKFKCYLHDVVSDYAKSTDTVEVFDNPNKAKRPTTEHFAKYFYADSEEIALEYLNDVLNVAVNSKTEA